MAFWATMAAGIGQRLMGAGGKASQNRAQIGANQSQISSLRESLENLDKLASANKEAAQVEQIEGFEDMGEKLSQMRTDIHRKRDDVNTGGFATNKYVDEQFYQTNQKMNDSFDKNVSNSNKELDKMLANIDAETEQKEASITGQIRVLQQQNKELGKRTKWYKNLF
tara:strand:+ start:589 stop:1089 length:501 start_codon:yes stop_codon:yes gene_type:complete